MYVSVTPADILQANDSLTQVINLYRQLVKGEEVNGDSTAMPTLPGERERERTSVGSRPEPAGVSEGQTQCSTHSQHVHICTD